MILVTKGIINPSDLDIIVCSDLFDEDQAVWYNMSLKECIEEICFLEDIEYVDYSVNIEPFSKTKTLNTFQAWTKDKVIFLVKDELFSFLANVERNPSNENT